MILGYEPANYSRWLSCQWRRLTGGSADERVTVSPAERVYHWTLRWIINNELIIIISKKVFEYLGVGEQRFSIQHPADPLEAPHNTFPGSDLILYRKNSPSHRTKHAGAQSVVQKCWFRPSGSHCCCMLRAIVTKTRPWVWLQGVPSPRANNLPDGSHALHVKGVLGPTLVSLCGYACSRIKCRWFPIIWV
jgi:hypothetical protein